jgi:hypothetical protein
MSASLLFLACLELVSAAGGSQDPLSFTTGRKAAVVIFVTPDCPVANALLPEVARLQHDFGSRGVSFALVHVDPSTTPQQALKHAAAFHITCAVLLDPRHQLAIKLGATRTPEAFVVTPDGKTVYHGRINDLYFAPGQRRRSPTSEDLRDALTAIVAGRPPPKSETPAIGCVVADFIR